MKYTTRLQSHNMKKEKYLDITLKAAAIFLWSFSPLFLFIVWDIHRENPILKEGEALGDMILRFPYRWDFELFFAGFFLVWGIYVWRATKDIQKDINLVKFTGWAFFVHGITYLITGAFRSNELVHLLTDSVYWFVFAFLILYLAPTTQKIKYVK